MKHINTAAIDSDFKRAFNYRPWLLGAAVSVALVLAVWLGILIAEYRVEPAENMAAAVNGPAVALTKVQNQATMEIPVAQVPAESDLLGQRLDQTEQWFQQASDSQYSIQLFMASTADADALESFLENAPESLDFEKIYIYETSINGSPMYSVLYNEYASRQTARTKLNSLPADLQASKPYLRRIGSLRKDLARNG